MAHTYWRLRDKVKGGEKNDFPVNFPQVIRLLTSAMHVRFPSALAGSFSKQPRAFDGRTASVLPVENEGIVSSAECRRA